MPPLRDRREDIPLLVNHFLTKYNKAFGRQVQGFTSEALALLTHYHWPGNVRELENVIERLVVISRHRILDVDDMPLDLMSVRGQLANDLFATGVDLRQAKAEFERHYILQTLEKYSWNQTEAAKRLGIHRNTLADQNGHAAYPARVFLRILDAIKISKIRRCLRCLVPA